MLMTTPGAEIAVLTRQDLANLLRISVVTLNRRRLRGEILDPLRGNGLPRWCAADVQDWLAHGAPPAAEWRLLKSR